jgi:hypothetical protein
MDVDQWGCRHHWSGPDRDSCCGVSRDNVEIVREVYEAVGRHDREAVFGLYHIDVVLDLSRIPVGGLTGQAPMSR